MVAKSAFDGFSFESGHPDGIGIWRYHAGFVERENHKIDSEDYRTSRVQIVNVNVDMVYIVNHVKVKLNVKGIKFLFARLLGSLNGD